VATHDAPPDFSEARAGIVYPPRVTSLWRAANTKKPVQVADAAALREYTEGDRFVTTFVAHYRSVVGVPLLKENAVIGVISIYRQVVGRQTLRIKP